MDLEHFKRALIRVGSKLRREAATISSQFDLVERKLTAAEVLEGLATALHDCEVPEAHRHD